MNTSQWCSALWALFCSMPLRLQVTVVLALVLLLVGLVVVSLGVGRVVGWVSERLERRREPAPAEPVDPFVRVLGLPPHEVSPELRGIVEASADDAEASR